MTPPLLSCARAQISGAKHISAGKYARLFVEKYVLEDIFKKMIVTDFEAYVASNFMYQTGARISATCARAKEYVQKNEFYQKYRYRDIDTLIIKEVEKIANNLIYINSTKEELRITNLSREDYQILREIRRNKFTPSR